MAPQRDPLSVHYDGVVYQIMSRAARASRGRRGVLAHITSPRAEFRALDRGGRTAHERAFTRAAYYLVWRAPVNAANAGEGPGPVWSLQLTWGEDLSPSARGRLARPVLVRLRPRDQARRRGPHWSDGTGFRSEEGARVDD